VVSVAEEFSIENETFGFILASENNRLKYSKRSTFVREVKWLQFIVYG